MNLIKIATLSLLLILSGCATTNITQEEVPPNHHSTRKFSTYKNVYIKPLTIAAEFKDANNNEEAVKEIDSHLFGNMQRIFPDLKKYDAYNASNPNNALIIEPHIVKMKAVGGLARGLLGVSAGSSAVILKVSYIDATTKVVIADPSFYQQANAWAAHYSAGQHDRPKECSPELLN